MYAERQVRWRKKVNYGKNNVLKSNVPFLYYMERDEIIWKINIHTGPYSEYHNFIVLKIGQKLA